MSNLVTLASAKAPRQVVHLADDLETIITIHSVARLAFEQACNAMTQHEEEWFKTRKKTQAYRVAERWQNRTGRVESVAASRLLAYRPKTMQEVRRKANYIFSAPLIWECATQNEFCALIRSMVSMDA
jgi:hypothetical protein